MNQRTSLRDLAPWVVLTIVACLGVGAKVIGSDAAVFQLLSTIAGVCGGALLPRKQETPTTTVTTDPTTVTTGPAT